MNKNKRCFQREKDLESGRKLGHIPLEIDEEGKEINPHIPKYISQVPWYLNTGRPTLKHQKMLKPTFGGIERFKKRGNNISGIDKYRFGACENCGSMTHKLRDCLDRPRKIGAKWTGKDIQEDETINQIELDFDGKRDRWNGYDTSNHIETADKFNLEEKKTSHIVNPEDGDNIDSIGLPNLRLRGDTAKYLKDVANESIYYDPKTRALRDVNNGVVNNIDDSELNKTNKIQMFCWNIAKRGDPTEQDINMTFQAAPSQMEKRYKNHIKEKTQKNNGKLDLLFQKYGGKNYLNNPNNPIDIEYKKKEKKTATISEILIKSKYEEDQYINNHTSIWGSFWNRGKWGYACCQTIVKDSYCNNI